jgi:hypothetical protein
MGRNASQIWGTLVRNERNGLFIKGIYHRSGQQVRQHFEENGLLCFVDNTSLDKTSTCRVIHV